MKKIILFDEKTKDIFPGVYRDYSFLDVPIWGNYGFGSLVNMVVSKYRDIGFNTIIIGWQDINKSLENLINNEENGCFISRVSSLVWTDFNGFKDIEEGPIKLSINKIPTDLYYLSRRNIKELYKIINSVSKIYTVQDLFKKYFFDGFLKIYDIDGYPFLMRDVYEYYRENMKTLSYLRDEFILSIIGKILPLSEVETYIGGNAINSYIAPGSRVFGTVVNSVIFEGVEVDKDSYVESSVILPGNKLEESVIVKNSLILSGTSRIIGRESSIGGSLNHPVRINHSFPLKRDLTVIGENINIPAYSHIGSYCIVGGKENPSDKLIVNDGNYLLTGFK